MTNIGKVSLILWLPVRKLPRNKAEMVDLRVSAHYAENFTLHTDPASVKRRKFYLETSKFFESEFAFQGLLSIYIFICDYVVICCQVGIDKT